MREIEIDLGDVNDYRGRWASKTLFTWGDNIDEMIENAQISYVDQDGGELGTEAPDDYSDAELRKLIKENKGE